MECSLTAKNLSASSAVRSSFELGPALLFMYFTIPSANKTTDNRSIKFTTRCTACSVTLSDDPTQHHSHVLAPAIGSVVYQRTWSVKVVNPGWCGFTQWRSTYNPLSLDRKACKRGRLLIAINNCGTNVHHISTTYSKKSHKNYCTHTAMPLCNREYKIDHQGGMCWLPSSPNSNVVMGVIFEGRSRGIPPPLPFPLACWQLHYKESFHCLPLRQFRKVWMWKNTHYIFATKCCRHQHSAATNWLESLYKLFYELKQ